MELGKESLKDAETLSIKYNPKTEQVRFRT